MLIFPGTHRRVQSTPLCPLCSNSLHRNPESFASVKLPSPSAFNLDLCCVNPVLQKPQAKRRIPASTTSYFGNNCAAKGVSRNATLSALSRIASPTCFASDGMLPCITLVPEPVAKAGAHAVVIGGGGATCGGVLMVRGWLP